MQTQDRERVHLPASTLGEYRQFSLYNSPYPAHDAGCAVDLYPSSNGGLSPVAGEVVETRTVRAPAKPYADDEEYLVLIDVDAARSGIARGGPGGPGGRAPDGLVARILHVRPSVAAGDTVAVGDPLGEMVRSGFFAPWVANHVHLGFRRAGQNLHRAVGSLPVVAGVTVDPVPWDGTGTVVETGDTYALLDAPVHPGDGFAGIAAVVGRDGDASGGGTAGGDPAGGAACRVALDGGFAHYAGGGVLWPGRERGGDRDAPPQGVVSLLNHPIGDLRGRTVTWRDVDVLANDARITGLSLFAGNEDVGAKLVCPETALDVGEEVRVRIRDSDDPIRLG